jgi:hypothetical protein
VAADAGGEAPCADLRQACKFVRMRSELAKDG